MEQDIFYINNIEAKSEYDEEAEKTRYYVNGYIDSGDMDKVNDIVTKDCMEDISQQFSKSTIKLDYDHETLRKKEGESEDVSKYNLSTIPLGKAINEDLKSKGNYVSFELNPNWKKFDSKGNVTMSFQEVWDSIQNGFYDAFSIAYFPVQTEEKTVNGEEARLLDKVDLINVALTGNPINSNATISQAMAKSLSQIKEKSKDKGDSMTEQKEYVDKKSFEDRVSKIEEQMKSVKESVDKLSESHKKAEEEKAKKDKEAKEKSEKDDKIDSLQKEVSEMKSILEKAQNKGKGPEDKSKQDPSEKSEVDANTLDML